jgi:alpha-beta hydrolase superfamily lysophospholipase
MWTETMTEHPLTLNTPDGHTIVGRQYLPAQPVAVLVISHGMAEHGDRYQELARWLGGHNILVITYHHRGHGPTARPNTRGITQTRTDGNGWWAIWHRW